MGRLIDADELRHDILHDSTFDNDTINYYIDKVGGMETAYDVDKVVERIELSLCSDMTQGECNKFSTCSECLMARHIAIVKGAVKDE